MGRGSVTSIFTCAMPPGGATSRLTLSETPANGGSPRARNPAGAINNENAAAASMPAVNFDFMISILRRAAGHGDAKPLRSGFGNDLARAVERADLPEDRLARKQLADDRRWKLGA